MITQPIAPLSHVLIMMNSEVSGSTIGYHGTVIRVIDRSVLANADSPGSWSYRVFIPVLKAQFEIVASKIISTGDRDDVASINHLLQEIQFDFVSSEESHGAYRINEKDWLHFHFQKHDETYDECKMSVPMKGGGSVAHRLYCRVRRDASLNREYVLRAIKTAINQKSESQNIDSTIEQSPPDICR